MEPRLPPLGVLDQPLIAYAAGEITLGRLREIIRGWTGGRTSWRLPPIDQPPTAINGDITVRYRNALTAMVAEHYGPGVTTKTWKAARHLLLFPSSMEPTVKLSEQIERSINALIDLLSEASRECERDDLPPEWDADLSDGESIADNIAADLEFNDDIDRLAKILNRIDAYDEDDAAAIKSTI